MRFKRTLILFFSILVVFAGLTACYSISLKEQAIAGFHSTLAIQMPGTVVPREVPMDVGKEYAPYVAGQKLYGNEMSGLRVAIYTSTLDAQAMSNTPNVTTDEVMHKFLLHELQLATTAVTAKLNAQDLTFTEAPIMIQGHRALHRGMEFSHDGQAMTADFIAFHTDKDVWIVIVAYNTYEKNKAQMAEKILASPRLQYEE